MCQNGTLCKSTQVPSLPTIGEGYGTTTQTIGTRMRKYSESVGRSYVASSVARWVTWFEKNCVTQLMLYTGDKLSSPIFCCLWVCQASVSPDQISTFSNIYRHTSPLLTMYHLISSSTNLYWPSTSQYRHILTQYHQVPLIIHHLVRHSSANWIISLFTTHLMSHAQYTWSSF